MYHVVDAWAIQLFIIKLDNINKNYYINKNSGSSLVPWDQYQLWPFRHKKALRRFEKGCEIVGGHMANDMLFDDFLTLATFRNLVFLRPARVN